MKFRKIFIGIDPATGEGQHHDCTAVIAGMVFSERIAGNNVTKVYILPEHINARMGFGEAIQAIIDLHSQIKKTYGRKDHEIQVLFENAGQQKCFYDHFKTVSHLPDKYVELVSTQGIDKRSRIAAACSYMQSNRVLLPEGRMDELENQLLYFPNERHDDMADAFAMVVNKAMSVKIPDIGVANGDFFPNQNKNKEQFFLHGEMRSGNKVEYYKQVQELVDKQNETFNLLNNS